MRASVSLESEVETLPDKSVTKSVTADCAMFDRVLADPEIVLFVSVCVPVSVTVPAGFACCA